MQNIIKIYKRQSAIPAKWLSSRRRPGSRLDLAWPARRSDGPSSCVATEACAEAWTPACAGATSRIALVNAVLSHAALEKRDFDVFFNFS
jgi:hypothetical protein